MYIDIWLTCRARSSRTNFPTGTERTSGIGMVASASPRYTYRYRYRYILI